MNLKYSILLILLTSSVSYSYVTYQPEQIHLSLGDNGHDIVVTWSTMDSTSDSVVQYGIGNFTMRETGTWKTFTDGGKLKRKQEIHRVQLSNLEPDTIYRYRVGGQFGWSSVFFFKTFPKHNNNWIPTFAIYGDLGNVNARSLPYLQQETQDGVYNAVFHNGDFAYDLHNNNGMRGDEFMRQIESIAAYVPYMTTVGNHEDHYNYSHYRERFTMPGETEGLYYSINIGPIHFLIFSSEIYYSKENYPHKISLKRQYDWIVNDLEKANLPENRAKHPWIIVMAHRPMYCTSDKTNDCSEPDTKVRIGRGNPPKYGLETVLHKYRVDMGIWAHDHAYERYFPLYNYTMFNGSYEKPYVNPKAPVHIITGSAGCKEGHVDFKPYRDYIAYRTRDYGYSVLKGFNKTHIYLEQISVEHDQKEIVDSFWLIKENK